MASTCKFYGPLFHIEPDAAAVDIVFVHLLDNDTWSEGKCFWPQEFLKVDLPEARVFSFSHDDNAMGSKGEASVNRIADIANALVLNLWKVRSGAQTTQRPIILVAHGLDGLVCKQATLLRDSPDPNTKTVASHIRRIAFFGTPHDQNSQYPAAFPDSYRKLFGDPQKGIEVLRVLEEGFIRMLPSRDSSSNGLQIVCFFEKGATSPTGKGPTEKPVVPKASATILNHPNYPLNGDHTSMCKFKNRENDSYRKVLEVLQDWMDNLPEPERGSEKVWQNISNGTFTGNYGSMNLNQVIDSNPQFGTRANFNFSPRQPDNPTTQQPNSDG
ncbi:hypothetical protein F5Y04DRAFT_253128 [Hypomontagnella monticulosa]|nr:hypothetical protein F5Y04DRAFT_253128 [Hypomontagnella monticulosa]